VPILFLASDDGDPDVTALDRANRIVDEARRWYLETLGRTFYAEPIRFVHGSRPATEYRDAYYDILSELGARGEIPPHTKLLVYVPRTIRQDLCCASRFVIRQNRLHFVDIGYENDETTGGYVLQTEDFSDDSYDETTSSHRNHAVGGGVIHELGHTFSLPHPAECESAQDRGSTPDYCWETPMWGWWNYPDGDPAVTGSTPYGWLDAHPHPEKGTLKTSAYMWNTGCSYTNPVPDCMAGSSAPRPPASSWPSVAVDRVACPRPPVHPGPAITRGAPCDQLWFEPSPGSH
jgi:hypothetical protein